MTKSATNGNGSERPVVLTKDTRVPISVVIATVAITVALVLGWADITGRLNDIERALSATWSTIDDEFYMRDFAAANNLTMPPHSRRTGPRSPIEKRSNQ